VSKKFPNFEEFDPLQKSKRISENLRSGLDVTVAVLDSGVNPEFFHIQNKRFTVINCIEKRGHIEFEHLSSELNTECNNGEGTHGSMVQSCIYAICPEASVTHFKVLDDKYSCSGSKLCFVLERAIDLNFQVINLSLGTRNESYLPWLLNLIRKAYEKGICVVCATSNIGVGMYPALFPYCFTVEAGEGQNLYSFSFQEGSNTEFLAPCIETFLPGLNGAPTALTGSSFGAGLIAGHVAKFLLDNPNHLPAEVKLALRQHALGKIYPQNN
jgi:Subtilase family